MDLLRQNGVMTLLNFLNVKVSHLVAAIQYCNIQQHNLAVTTDTIVVKYALTFELVFCGEGIEG